MSLSSFQFVEAFHLSALRVLEVKADRAQYVVKGGVNLRAWFGSLRYSEDLDVDVLRGEVFEWRERLDAVLGAPALLSQLRMLGLRVTRCTKPKQTETTQRWKIELEAGGHGVPLHTKIELSRRGSADEHVLEPVLAEIVRPYGISAPSAQHYVAAAAIRQKIAALADRRETQARDVWDLEHLFRTTRGDPRPLPRPLAAKLEVAVERAMGMSFDDFRGQVVPYLEADHQDLFGNADAWHRIQELVVDRLVQLQA